MSKQFEFLRDSLMRFVNELDEKTSDVQPNGFNNTIRWNLGHVLTCSEQMMFGYPEHPSNIPASYNEMFMGGSKPSEWGPDIPTLQELAGYLENQTARIRELSSEFFAQKLPFKFFIESIQTYGELFEVSMFHEATHLGQMQAMKRIIAFK
jgi:hypothetical protein